MIVETKKESLCINQIIAKKSQDVTIEGDVIIPDIKPDILNAINTNGTVCVYKKEIIDGKVRLDGSVNLYIMYLPDNETDTVRSINTNLDFTQIIDVEQAREDMTLEEDVMIKAIECKVLNGRKVSLKVHTNMTVKIYSNENMDIISEIENMPDMQMLNNTVEINSLLGTGRTKIYAKENIAIDNIDEVAEIMKVDMKIVNKDLKISYNKVLAKADLDVRIMYLTEDNRINVVTSQVPVMGFVDIANVCEENICDTNYSINNILIKPNSNETHGIYIEVQIELICSAYERKEINIIQDLYSPNEEVRFAQKEINAMTNKQNKRDLLQITQQVQIPEIIGHRLYDVEVRTNITDENVLNDKIVYDGNVQLKFIFEAENTAMIDVRSMELPFNFSTEIKGVNKNSFVSTNINVAKQDFVIGQNGNIDCNINLEFEINVSMTTGVNIIENLNVEELQEEKSYSMIIYFVKQGDTLWNIAKKFKSTVEDIACVNNIEDVNRIRVGEQLFIPKYSNRIRVNG